MSKPKKLDSLGYNQVLENCFRKGLITKECYDGEKGPLILNFKSHIIQPDKKCRMAKGEQDE